MMNSQTFGWIGTDVSDADEKVNEARDKLIQHTIVNQWNSTYNLKMISISFFEVFWSKNAISPVVFARTVLSVKVLPFNKSKSTGKKRSGSFAI